MYVLLLPNVLLCIIMYFYSAYIFWTYVILPTCIIFNLYRLAVEYFAPLIMTTTLEHSSYLNLWIISFIITMLISYVIGNLMIAVLESAINTIFVCFAENPDTFMVSFSLACNAIQSQNEYTFLFVYVRFIVAVYLFFFFYSYLL